MLLLHQPLAVLMLLYKCYVFVGSDARQFLPWLTAVMSLYICLVAMSAIMQVCNGLYSVLSFVHHGFFTVHRFACRK